ncbi:hypothetical protein A2755_00745 [Candidatus Wolfebacteria bacterium RIFCSPHIGHO2_01_FULL_48_22]|uniref:Large ribosomal subunit protein bL25 n=2 Tax=Candidatus Wolfeibacteriota TaxID=1752735 RepID=A0A1F8DVI6_9BACT|nr:MAG: hypothetical protein A2755_00745 [Candidatus Wolfebacteria bacterium RIFCSPHIGHO2_01_FULL_48_22]OGM93543.1 MAG: hypothetical protein A2935_02855 [Candidatus Wolfebacteria bacterium RIFCSPLOWO2_01_FULL_47_17b]
MLQLQTQKRDIFGKKTNMLRAQGLVPAEIYGHGKENLHVSVLAKDFDKVLKEAGESTIIEVVLDGEKHPVLIYDIQRDPLKDTYTHVDFYAVRMDEKVRTEVPIKFTGEAPAVKAYAGILVKALDEIELEALPADLPASIVVDLSDLAELNQTIYVKDIPLIERVRFITDLETPVASVTEQKEEVVEVTPPASEVPTEGEEKAEELPAEEKQASEKE